MIAGLVMRDILRMPLRLVFTSAAQRHHKPYTKWLIRRMDAVVATSAAPAPSRGAAHGGDARHRPRTLSPPRPRGRVRCRRPARPPRRGLLRRIRHQKGTDLFVDAMIALLPDHPEWTAIITGRTTGPA
jgi:mannosyltransferase